MASLVTRRAAAGPFLLPTRGLIPLLGAIAFVSGGLHLADELHRGEVDRLYAVTAGLVWLLFAGSVIGAYFGRKPAILAAGVLAFIVFGLQTSTHFVPGANAISDLTRKEGFGFAIPLLALVVSCALVAIFAVIAWGNSRGQNRSVATAPLLAVAALGVPLFLLLTADNLQFSAFGTLSAEDGALIAVVTAIVWTIGALWSASAPVRGLVLCVAATANVVVPFWTIHVLGPVSIARIAKVSGLPWSILATGSFVCALFSLVAGSGLLVLAVIRARRRRALRKKTPPALRQRMTS